MCSAGEIENFAQAQNETLSPELMTEFMVHVKSGVSANSVKDKLLNFDVSAAVADFKGPAIFGVVRITQFTTESTRIEATFTGLHPGMHTTWSINEFGNLTNGAASTGRVFNPTRSESKLLGDLGTLDVDENGVACYKNVIEKMNMSDLIGRAVVLYGSDDVNAAAVIARTNAHFVVSKI